MNKSYTYNTILIHIYAFQIGDAIYYESVPVCDFLDEAYPGRKLLPDTPEERVKDKMALTHYDMVIQHLLLK